MVDKSGTRLRRLYDHGKQVPDRAYRAAHVAASAFIIHFEHLPAVFIIDGKREVSVRHDDCLVAVPQKIIDADLAAFNIIFLVELRSIPISFS